ncbi:FkbM family methyltransferase [Chloroflexota bacterium]
MRFKWFALAYYYLLYGVLVRFMPDGKCSVAFQGTEITMPRESIGIFFEVFIHRVYEQFPGPKRGDIVIDVGANVGAFTVKAAKLVGDKGLVVAIEPEPMNLALLQRNIDSHNLNNVKVIRKAVWDKAVKVWLYLSKHSALHSLCYASEDRIEVEADCLDNIIAKLGLSHVDFIKIDVEGAEPEALGGAERTLTSPSIRLCMEACHVLPDGQPELPILVSYLVSKQFQPHVYTIFEGPYIYATKQD